MIVPPGLHCERERHSLFGGQGVQTYNRTPRECGGPAARTSRLRNSAAIRQLRTKPSGCPRNADRGPCRRRACRPRGIARNQVLAMRDVPAYRPAVETAVTAVGKGLGQGRSNTGPSCLAPAPDRHVPTQDRRNQPPGRKTRTEEPKATWLKTQPWRNSRPS